jgi:erythromycin esterase-like protein
MPAVASRFAALSALAADGVDRLDRPTATRYAEELAAIATILDGERATLRSRLGMDAAIKLTHQITLLRQRVQFQGMVLASATPMQIIAQRDVFMTENLVELEKGHTNGDGVIVWAHNVHLAASLEQFDSLGEHLRAKLGDRYFSVGLRIPLRIFPGQGRGRLRGHRRARVLDRTAFRS